MRARPKTACLYHIENFMATAGVWISCYPQQRWEVVEEEKSSITLNWKFLTITLPKDDFAKRWIKIEDESTLNDAIAIVKGGGINAG